MIYQIPVDQITGLAKYGLALSCTAVSDLSESDLARYAPPSVRPSWGTWHCTHTYSKRGEGESPTSGGGAEGGGGAEVEAGGQVGL